MYKITILYSFKLKLKCPTEKQIVYTSDFNSWSIFCKRINILYKNQYFLQKSIFCTKINILYKNQYLVQKSIFCTKINILYKDQHFVQCQAKNKVTYRETDRVHFTERFLLNILYKINILYSGKLEIERLTEKQIGCTSELYSWSIFWTKIKELNRETDRLHIRYLFLINILYNDQYFIQCQYFVQWSIFRTMIGILYSMKLKIRCLTWKLIKLT